MEPQNPWGWLKRGLLRAHHSDFSNALTDFSEVLKLTPKNPEVIAAIEQVAYAKKRYSSSASKS
jgi:cytochrome c-type biogenesis protein CcmH/NrfG